MLVVTANWAFTDGTLCAAAPAAHVSSWLRLVHRAVIRGGFRRDGCYRPVSQVDIVLAGDTLDCLTSAAWLAATRPWHGGAAAAECRGRVAFAAATQARRLLGGLGEWSRRGLPVPAADERNRPRLSASRAVPVRLAALEGDRDRPIQSLAAVAARRGCILGRSWSTADVMIVHGDELDPLCAGDGDGTTPAWCGREPTMAESVAVDLVAAFGKALVEIGLDRAVVRRLLAALAPAGPLELPVVLAAWFRGRRPEPPLATEARAVIAAEWRRSVAAWHRTARREPPRHSAAGSPLDLLAAAFEAAVVDEPGGCVRGFPVELQPGAVAAPGRFTVLGHPAGPGTGAALACLGAGAGGVSSGSGGSAGRGVPPAVVRAAPPPTIARLEDGDWEWLSPADAGPGMPVVPGRHTIIDAA